MSYSEDLKIFKAMHTQLMHNPEMKYVSGGHLSTILKADDYVKAIRSSLQKKYVKYRINHVSYMVNYAFQQISTGHKWKK